MDAVQMRSTRAARRENEAPEIDTVEGDVLRLIGNVRVVPGVSLELRRFSSVARDRTAEHTALEKNVDGRPTLGRRSSPNIRLPGSASLNNNIGARTHRDSLVDGEADVMNVIGERVEIRESGTTGIPDNYLSRSQGFIRVFLDVLSPVGAVGNLYRLTRKCLLVAPV
jgi:hypothetical protein